MVCCSARLPRPLPVASSRLRTIALFTWHAMHRIFHSLHDVGLHTGVMAKLVCYGGALTVTVLVASALLVIGF